MKVKKILTMCLLLVFMLTFTLASTTNASMTGAWTHRYDSSGGGPLQEVYGLSSMNNQLSGLISGSGAAAFATTPVGKDAFKISFYVQWNDENLDEGQGGYLDNFLELYFSSSASFPDGATAPFVHDTGVVPLQFRLANRHTQAVKSASLADTINIGIADFGGKTLKNINAHSTSKFYIELSQTAEETDLLRLWMDDAGTERGICYFDIGEDIFNAATTQYLNIGQFGSPYFTAYNFKVEASDISASVGATLTDWKHLAGVEPLREVTGLTSSNYLGSEMVSWGTAAAFAAVPIGKESFKASFDLTWMPTNVDEGAGGYTDNFLGLYIADAATFPEVANDQPYVTGIPQAFRIINRHIQGVTTTGNIATASAGIVDFGGVTLMSKTMATGTFYIELANNVLSLWMQDGESIRGLITLTYNAGSFNSSTSQYLCFAQYNNPKMLIKNLTVYESDISTSITTHAVNFYAAATATPTETPTVAPTEGATPTTAASEDENPQTGSPSVFGEVFVFAAATLLIASVLVLRTKKRGEA